MHLKFDYLDLSYTGTTKRDLGHDPPFEKHTDPLEFFGSQRYRETLNINLILYARRVYPLKILETRVRRNAMRFEVASIHSVSYIMKGRTTSNG